MDINIKKQKLENCEVCGVNKAKYTCPKCEVRTCTATCVNIHKKELNCDGIRDETKYVPLNAFTDLDLLSDYRLLEKIGRTVERLQQDDSKKFTRTNNLPVSLYKLKQAANNCSIKLDFMPHNFTRNKENTTFYNWKTHELSWRIEWIFPHAESIKWVTRRVLDTTRLSDILDNILEDSPFENDTSINDDDDSDTNDKIQRKLLLHEKLEHYRSASLSGIRVLLKAENIKQSSLKFYELDLTLSLRENLMKKTIIEFPTIYVVLKGFDIYDIIDTDDEEQPKSEESEDTANNSYRRIRRKRPFFNRNSIQNKINNKIDNKNFSTNNTNKEKNIKSNDPVNFFFNDNLSDSETF